MSELNKAKKLSPEERIKRLKEIEEQNKKEIEEAKKLIEEAHEEIADDEKNKIEIPELTPVDVPSLFEEEKELEEVIQQTPTPPLSEEQAQTQYGIQLSHEPAQQLYNQVKELYNQAQSEGMTPELTENLMQIGSALEQKYNDTKTGVYTASPESLEQANVSKSIVDKLLGNYKGNDTFY